MCGVNGTTNRITLTRDELLQKLRKGTKQMENLVKELRMMLDELENLPPLEKIKVRNYNPEILSLMCTKSSNLDNAYLSVAKRMQSWECKRDVSVAGVNFLCNFLGEATTWPRLHRTLDSSTYSNSL
ncbi:hypothetical protein C5167_004514 [Papaver somniferum]|uniref:Uncharacterized protein n=1 Tax=Papaver somniferum TaxID=3469 RepID=A0A4Y7JAW7_PAPSO|nr:hypothetical protein C5167_004514 [Papaver somniferum]